jgi:hypothetical protein
MENGAATIGITGATCCRIICRSYDLSASMKLVIAATGASGAIYLQRLLTQIDCSAHEVHMVMSAPATQVAKQELDVTERSLGFESVPRVWQRARNNDRHRVIKEGPRYFFSHIYRLNFLVWV